jgi:hypothetical protein
MHHRITLLIALLTVTLHGGVSFAQEAAEVTVSAELSAEPSAEPSETEGAVEEVDPARERASVRFRRGVVFYESSDYRAALNEFRLAYEIAPNYRVLFNLAQASFQLHDYAEAKNWFEEYLESGGDEIPEERRGHVERELRTLQQYVSTLDLRTNPEGVEISIDDQLVGTTPLAEPVLLSAGRREVSARLAGYAPETRVVDLAGGEAASLELALVPLSSSEAPRRLGASFWVSLIATSGVALAAVTTGALSLGANSDLDDELQRFPGVAADIESARDRVDRLTLATDILIGVVGVGTLVTILTGIFGRTVDEDGQEDEVTVRATGNGLRVTF